MVRIELNLNGLVGYYLEQKIDKDDCQLCGLEYEMSADGYKYFFNYNEETLNTRLSAILNILLDK